VQTTVEHERKLEAPQGFELPDLGGEPLEPRVFTSVYHDTGDRSLARAGITLRRRTERGPFSVRTSGAARSSRSRNFGRGGTARS